MPYEPRAGARVWGDGIFDNVNALQDAAHLDDLAGLYKTVLPVFVKYENTKPGVRPTASLYASDYSSPKP